MRKVGSLGGALDWQLYRRCSNRVKSAAKIDDILPKQPTCDVDAPLVREKAH